MLDRIRNSLQAKVVTSVVAVLMLGFSAISLISYNRLEHYYSVERKREVALQESTIYARINQEQEQLRVLSASMLGNMSQNVIPWQLGNFYRQVASKIEVPVEGVRAYNSQFELLEWYGYRYSLPSEAYPWLTQSDSPTFSYCDDTLCRVLVRLTVTEQTGPAIVSKTTIVAVVNSKVWLRNFSAQTGALVFLLQQTEDGEQRIRSVHQADEMALLELISKEYASNDSYHTEVVWNEQNWYLSLLKVAAHGGADSLFLGTAYDITESKRFLLQTAWTLGLGALLLMIASLATILWVTRRPLRRILKTVDALPLLADAKFDEFQRLLGKNGRATESADETYLLREMAREIGKQLEAAQTELMDRLSETEWLSLHDPLTKLANRRLFDRLLQEQLDEYDTLSLLFLDVDDFKLINDTSGHEVGDFALTKLAELLQQQFQEPSWSARLSGDEFAVCLPGIDIEDATAQAAELLERARVTQIAGKRRLHLLSLSIGVVNSPTHGHGLDQLLIKADMAMYRCKELGKGQLVALTDPALEKSLHEQRRLASQTKTAIRDQLLALFFQPIADSATKQISHHEVLLRIKNMEGQLVSAFSFIQAAEKSKDIRLIDEWVLSQSLNLMMTAIRGGEQMRLAVNISGVTFNDKATMRGILGRIEFSQCASSLTIEITESSAMEDMALTLEHIDKLHALGCRVALDDFGVGYSSINTLLTLPFDFVKIDGSFVRRLQQDNAIREFFIWADKLASLKGFGLIAEFVEDEETLQELHQLGISLVQGYYIGKPSPDLPRHHDLPAAKSADAEPADTLSDTERAP